MYIEDKNLIIIPTRKCGSTSIITALSEYCNSAFNLDKYQNGCKETIQARGIWEGDTHIKNDVYITTRNPLDRLISGYFFTLKSTVFWANTKEPSFKEFVYTVFVENKKMPKFWAHHIKTPISDFITWKGDIIPHKAIKLESFEEDFKKLCSDKAINASLPHLNKSKRHLDYGIYYDRETREIVENHFLKDFNIFNY
jgi:hypothetical protein